MLNLSLLEIARIVGGEIRGDTSGAPKIINSIVTDSRSHEAKTNFLFVALKGPVHNGHHFIPELLEKGIKTFLVSERNNITAEASFILVENTTLALQQLAAFHRNKFGYPVVGITGSNGKTIVKEWLHDILSHKHKIVRSPKSYNSQVGVPLSVLLMNESFDLGIFEAGISKPGEMTHLEKVIAPDIGLLTNIGDAHQEFFESLEQKLDEKLLLFVHCKKLVCRIDNESIREKTEHFCRHNAIEPVFWGTGDAKTQLKFITEKDKLGCAIHIVFNSQQYRFKIPFTDDSSIENACHCFAAIVAMGKDPDLYLSRFASLQPLAMRLEIKQGINHCILINDYYNSDLHSLGIALSVLKQQAADEHQTRVVILSDIQQTGLPQAELYKKVNQFLSNWKIDRLIGIGPNMLANRQRFQLTAEFYNDNRDFENRFQLQSLHSAAVLIKGARQFRFEKISGLLQQKAHQTVLEINMNALVHNLNIFRDLLKPETKIMVMVKAFSYGSGDVEIARLLQHQNVDYLAVAVADEGVQLRNAGIILPIIVMNPERDSFQNMINYRLEPNVYDINLLREFTESVEAAGIDKFPIHLKIDTGMNRLGLKTNEEIVESLTFLQQKNSIKVSSVFSHLAGSDEASLDVFSREQFKKFEELFELVQKKLSYPIDRHILNSAGIERFPEKQYEMVRLGIGLYGISQTGLPLENIGTLKSTVSQVKTISTIETVGYNRKGKVEKASRIAVVPVGYADGLDRKLGNGRGKAFVNGQKVPIIGNVCMDMLMLDVTGMTVKPGDRIEFFGPHISIRELAEIIGTIPYEILTGISQRVKRVYLQE